MKFRNVAVAALVLGLLFAPVETSALISSFIHGVQAVVHSLHLH
jgi:hypothetical protein